VVRREPSLPLAQSHACCRDEAFISDSILVSWRLVIRVRNDPIEHQSSRCKKSGKLVVVVARTETRNEKSNKDRTSTIQERSHTHSQKKQATSQPAIMHLSSRSSGWGIAVHEPTDGRCASVYSQVVMIQVLRHFRRRAMVVVSSLAEPATRFANACSVAGWLAGYGGGGACG